MATSAPNVDEVAFNSGGVLKPCTNQYERSNMYVYKNMALFSNIRFIPICQTDG